MAESIVNVTEGSGKKLHTFQRTIGANNVEDEIVIPTDGYLATYTITSGSTTSLATAASHTLEIMAGASLNVYLRRLQVWQIGLATTAAIVQWGLFRLSTAGTGGGAITPLALDSTDSAAGATAMTLPTVKGTEGNLLLTFGSQLIQTVGTGGTGNAPLIVDFTFPLVGAKVPRIAAGTANGLALKQSTGAAAATCVFVATITEANF